VDQVATYFAVNTVLSHWDGFFNNYFAYRDPKRGKWILVPWDQDKTWGYYAGLPDDRVFFDMPLTFGMEGGKGALRAGWPGGGAEHGSSTSRTTDGAVASPELVRRCQPEARPTHGRRAVRRRLEPAGPFQTGPKLGDGQRVDPDEPSRPTPVAPRSRTDQRCDA
jgi:hypothetical protein